MDLELGVCENFKTSFCFETQKSISKQFQILNRPVFILGGNPVLYSPAPRGDCDNCCEIREAKDIKFLLYTRSNRKDAKQIYISDEKRIRHLNKTAPLVLYLHGFSESAPGTSGASSYELRDGKQL